MDQTAICIELTDKFVQEHYAETGVKDEITSVLKCR